MKSLQSNLDKMKIALTSPLVICCFALIYIPFSNAYDSSSRLKKFGEYVDWGVNIRLRNELWSTFERKKDANGSRTSGRFIIIY